MTRGQLPQWAGSLGLNGGGAAGAVPLQLPFGVGVEFHAPPDTIWLILQVIFT